MKISTHFNKIYAFVAVFVFSLLSLIVAQENTTNQALLTDSSDYNNVFLDPEDTSQLDSNPTYMNFLNQVLISFLKNNTILDEDYVQLESLPVPSEPPKQDTSGSFFFNALDAISTIFNPNRSQTLFHNKNIMGCYSCNKALINQNLTFHENLKLFNDSCEYPREENFEYCKQGDQCYV